MLTLGIKLENRQQFGKKNKQLKAEKHLCFKTYP